MTTLTAVLFLFACGESVTFEEAAEDAAPADAEVPEGSADEDYEPVTTPEDGPQREIEAKPEGSGQGRPKAQADPRDNWPPVVVPQGQREREWEWEFEYKGPTKAPTDRDMTLEEMKELEMKSQREIDGR